MVDVTIKRQLAHKTVGNKIVVLESGTTLTGGTDTLTLTLSQFGLSQVLAVQGYVHTTDYSVMVTESGTTAVSGGILTYTTGSGNNNKRRIVTVFGR